MKKYAFIRNNIVQLVDHIDQEDYQNHSKHWDLIIDIDSLSPEPKAGWELIGNKLLPVSPIVQQQLQQMFGSALCLEMINKMGARNLSLSQMGDSVNVASILTALNAVKGLLETGALKTARIIISSQISSIPSPSDILQEVVTKITSFLKDKGWD